MKKLITVFILLLFLSGCLPYNLVNYIEEDESFNKTYHIGDEIPDFRESFINSGNREVGYLIETNNLNMEVAGVYNITITVYEEGNKDNFIYIDLTIIVNDQTL